MAFVKQGRKPTGKIMETGSTKESKPKTEKEVVANMDWKKKDKNENGRR